MHKKIISLFTLLAAVSAISFASPRVSAQRQAFISYALGLQGTKYVFGAQDPSEGGLDCSGFVMYAARNYYAAYTVDKKTGDVCKVNKDMGRNPVFKSIQLPRTANAMYQKCEKISAKDREPGDLVFFKNNLESDRVTHVGIYGGIYHGKNAKFNGKRVFISSVSDGPRTGVIISLMDEKFWKEHYFASGRIMPSTNDAQKF